MNDQHFCLLCSKHRNEPLTNVPLAEIEEGVIIKVDACEGCARILHNIRRIYFDEKNKWIEKQRREAESLLKGRIEVKG